MNSKILILVLVLLVLASAGTSFYFYKQLNDYKANPQRAAQQEIAALVSRVSKLIVLPTGEEPTVATVSDLSKLKDQPFFAKASVGDKVLIYTNAKKAILYDPTTDKIVEVAPVNIGNTNQSVDTSNLQSGKEPPAKK